MMFEGTGDLKWIADELGFNPVDIIDLAIIQAFYLPQLFDLDVLTKEPDKEESEYTKKAREQLQGKEDKEPMTFVGLVNQMVCFDNVSYSFSDIYNNMTPNMFMKLFDEVGKYFERISPKDKKGKNSNNNSVSMTKPDDYEI